MGGWVAAEASVRLDAYGVFQIAPALYMPAYPVPAPAILVYKAEIVHGWGDAVIPCENSIRFARLRGCTLHLVRGDHSFEARIPLLREPFGSFLAGCGVAG